MQIQLIENCWQSEVAGLDLRFIRNGNAEPVTLLLCRITRPSAVLEGSFRGYCLGRLQFMQHCLVDAGYNPLPITEAQILEHALHPFPLKALAELRRSEDEHYFSICGISDIIGLKRDQAWTEYACRTAAAFTHAFIMTGPIISRS